jgi:ribosome-associated toxin RatA of RatAB toxin-antitoxin module
MGTHLGPEVPNTISALYEAIRLHRIVRARQVVRSPLRPVADAAAVRGRGTRGGGVKQVRKSVLLWYSPQEMYALVTGVPEYPQFLPWCERAEVLEERETGVTARLYLSYLGVRQAFTTRNEQVRGERVVLELVDGPFSVLDGTWRFVPVPPAEGIDARACKIEFDLRYSFANAALEALISPVFDRIANTFVDSFVKRAEQVYGAR